MSYATVISIGREAIFIALLVASPALLLGLVTGLIISIFQATTQIQEPTLTFIPKILVIALAILFFGPWMLALLAGYMLNTIQSLPSLIR